jgi:hypothetical protein
MLGSLNLAQILRKAPGMCLDKVHISFDTRVSLVIFDELRLNTLDSYLNVIGEY